MTGPQPDPPEPATDPVLPHYVEVFGLRTALLSAGVLGLFIPVYYLLLAETNSLRLAGLGVGLAIGLLMAGVWLREDRLPARWLHAAPALLVLILLTYFALWYAYSEYAYDTLFALLIMAMGLLMLDTGWLVGLLIPIALLWSILARAYSPAAFPAGYALQLALAASLSLVVHSVRLTVLRQIGQINTQNAGQQSALRESENRYRVLSDATFEGIVLHQGGLIVDANRTLAAMFGYDGQSLAGRRAWDFLAPECHALAQEKIAQGDEAPYELTGVRREGARFPIEVCGKVLKAGPEPLRVVVVRDLTEHKRVEAEREMLLNELRDFPHTVAHDLKNPLSLATAYTALLSEIYGDRLDDTGREYLAEVEQATTRMHIIIDALLMLAETHSRDVQVSKLDMEALVGGVLHHLSLDLAHAAAEIELPDQWPTALGHGPWVEQVWFNYLSNAIKYGGTPPRITVGADTPAEGHARFWVRDQGPGLLPGQADRLFSPFTQLDPETSYRGHGLGLSIVKRIIERLQGQVGVEGAPGQGCLFYFTLPRARE